MSSSTLVGQWALAVWMDLGEPANISYLTISGYATSVNTLGRLNSLVGSCYSGTGYSGPGTLNYDVAPDLGGEELSLINQMYLISYYNSLAQATMGVGAAAGAVAGSPTTPAQSLAEGDSKIAFGNIPAIGAQYVGLAKQAKIDLNYQVNCYIKQVQGGDTPRSILWYGIEYPTWSRGYIGP